MDFNYKTDEPKALSDTVPRRRCILSELLDLPHGWIVGGNRSPLYPL